METLEEMQARHRKEKRDLQSRVTGKKKNATKKTRKGVNDECAQMERDLAEKQAAELASLDGGADDTEEEQAEDIADGVAEIKLDDQTAETQPPQSNTTAQSKADAQAPAQPEGKKRNRHKERLARRAAEQIAAAEAAEAEAANMTDHRGAERSAMEATFKAHSLVEREIRPDGHCLFSAVADQLQHRGQPLRLRASSSRPGGAGDETPGYKIVRGVAADWIEGHADDFAPFLEEDVGSYAGKMRDTAEWGGQIELMALASAYNIEINVVQNGSTEKISAPEPSGEGEPERIWLAYYRHGYGLGEHYNSLRKAP